MQPIYYLEKKAYVTAKDLPMAPKGIPIEIHRLEYDLNPVCKIFLKLNSDNCQTTFDDYNDFHFYIGKYNINDLISEGWIEERKPLAIYVNLYSNGLSSCYHNTEEAARRSHCKSDYIRTVKFVEEK